MKLVSRFVSFLVFSGGKKSCDSTLCGPSRMFAVLEVRRGKSSDCLDEFDSGLIVAATDSHSESSTPDRPAGITNPNQILPMLIKESIEALPKSGKETLKCFAEDAANSRCPLSVCSGTDGIIPTMKEKNLFGEAGLD